MKCRLFHSILMLVCLFGTMPMAYGEKEKDWKYSGSEEVDEGPTDGPPGSMVLIPEGEFLMER